MSSQAALGVGTATFVQGYGLASATWRAPAPELFREAVDRGIRYLDTAASYGDGEVALGDIHDVLHTRSVRVSTKLDVAVMSGDRSGLESAVRTSLDRLRCGRVDTLLAHSADTRALSASAVSDGWRELKRAGLVGRTGASTYGIDDARFALSLPECDVVQAEFSVLNQEVVPAVAKGKRPGQELVVRSVLCKGLLTGNRASAPPDARAVVETIEALERLAAEWNYPLPELAIRFALDTPGVDVVLVGVGSVGELETALRAAARQPLEVGQLNRLREFDRSGLDAVHPERWGRIAVE
jgi:aryl-alcohol dehydrogenase-like predicted oxidoreductase